ncbi:MAG: hypothetical protein ACE3L7_33430 [Candidatus Pristimantibacillus sp.]
MLNLIIISSIIVLLIIKFTSSYRESKKIKGQTEANFREVLINTISENRVLSDEEKAEIKVLSDRKLLVYLTKNEMIETNKYFQLLQKQFNQE